MAYLQTLAPLQFSYHWRIRDDVAEVVPSFAGAAAGIAFVWVSALSPVIVAPFFRFQLWFEIAGSIMGILMASGFTWYLWRQLNRPPPWRVDLASRVLGFNETTVPFDQILELKVAKELSAPTKEDRISVYTLYVVLESADHEAIAVFPWKPTAVALGRATAEMIGVPFSA